MSAISVELRMRSGRVGLPSLPTFLFDSCGFLLLPLSASTLPANLMPIATTLCFEKTGVRPSGYTDRLVTGAVQSSLTDVVSFGCNQAVVHPHFHQLVDS